jgi:hypothetical protein
MTEYSSTDKGPGEARGAAGTESFDLLIRHLEAAKQVFSSPEGASDAELSAPDVLCTLIYAQPGTFCPLLYVHFPAAKEADTESA